MAPAFTSSMNLTPKRRIHEGTRSSPDARRLLRQAPASARCAPDRFIGHITSVSLVAPSTRRLSPLGARVAECPPKLSGQALGFLANEGGTSSFGTWLNT